MISEHKILLDFIHHICSQYTHTIREFNTLNDLATELSEDKMRVTLESYFRRFQQEKGKNNEVMREILKEGGSYYEYEQLYENGIMWGYIQQKRIFQDDFEAYKNAQKTFRLDYYQEVFLFLKNKYPDIVVGYMTNYMAG